MSWIVVFLSLLSVIASQVCPRCKWNACSITPSGFQNCSACQSGALTTVAVKLNGETDAWHTQIIGICEPCPVGCTQCYQGIVDTAMSVPSIGIVCSSCNSGYTYNWSSGGCASCSSNCISCDCIGNQCWATECDNCSEGFLLNTSHMFPNCYSDPNTTAQQAKQDQSGSSDTGKLVGLSIWGVIMTLSAVIFGVLYWRGRNTKATTLMGGIEGEGRKVTF